MQLTDDMVRVAAEALVKRHFGRHAEFANTSARYQTLFLYDARAALTAALAAMWRPIESAPKDGSEFLGFGGGVEGIQTVRWDDRVGCWDTETASLEDWDNQAEGYSRPTHFMPLPSPPSKEGE